MKTRRYKITCWVDVPITFEQTIQTEDDMENYISKKFAEDNIYGDFEVDKMPLPDELDDIYSGRKEEITDFESPVGFIAPDGLFYGMEDGTDSLAHCALAKQLYDYYKDEYDVDTYSDLGIDYTLELMGFIKIRDRILRYYTGTGNSCRYWSDAQIKTVYKWMKHFEYIDAKDPTIHGYSILFDGPNGRQLSSNEFIKMDKFAINKIFQY